MTSFRNPILAKQARMSQLDLECIDEIKRALNKFRFDPKYRGAGQRVPLVQFAELCSVSRQTLYNLVRGDLKGIEPSTRDRIMAAIDLVDRGGLRFVRKVTGRSTAMRRYSWNTFEWQPVMPDGSPPPPIPQRHRTAKDLAAREAVRATWRDKKRAEHANQKLQLPK